MTLPLAIPAHPLRAICWAGLALASCALLACNAPTRSTPPPTAELVEPDPNIATRDLFCGAGGCGDAPAADSSFRFRERHERGSSPNLVVEDARGRVWEGGELA